MSALQATLFGTAASYAPGPVWKGSVRGEVKFARCDRRAMVRLYHDARRLERRTRQPGRQDGTIGRNGLAVLHALIFDFLDFASGRLDPSYASIARRANISVRSAARGLVKLKSAGVLNWVRRCASVLRDGRHCLEQETNAYAILPAGQWKGAEPPMPAPEPGTTGEHPPIAAGLDAAKEAIRDGRDRATVLAALTNDPHDTLALALASLGTTIMRNAKLA